MPVTCTHTHTVEKSIFKDTVILTYLKGALIQTDTPNSEEEEEVFVITVKPDTMN